MGALKNKNEVPENPCFFRTILHRAWAIHLRVSHRSHSYDPDLRTAQASSFSFFSFLCFFLFFPFLLFFFLSLYFFRFLFFFQFFFFFLQELALVWIIGRGGTPWAVLPRGGRLGAKLFELQGFNLQSPSSLDYGLHSPILWARPGVSFGQELTWSGP